jgi:hypothetical protein
MSFTILVPDADPSWPEKISRAVPGAVAKAYADPKGALADIETADAAYGLCPAFRALPAAEALAERSGDDRSARRRC